MARVHITGASGAGVSTLGAALAASRNAAHLDTDNFYWLKTDPPFTTKRPAADRLALLHEAFDQSPNNWILSGSITSWGNALIPLFDLVIFVITPTPVRIERIKAREHERYGDAIAPGGKMYEQSQAFIAWASHYDEPDFTSRSRAGHEEWLKLPRCPVLRLDGAGEVALLVVQANDALKGETR